MTTAYTAQHQTKTTDAKPKPRYPRTEAARHVSHLRQARAVGAMSERAVAREAGVPRSTLRHWNARRARLEAAGVPAFLETEEGIEWCERLVSAMLFVMSLRCPAGIRCICEVLELSKLDAVVASSFGSVQALALKMLAEVDAAGSELQQQLAETTANQERRRITVCEDETFHPDICLVAMEPASGFIVLEEYAARRDADTWTAAMNKALKGLPFDVVQATSDDAKALKKHAKDGLQAHRSPDLFHVQHELVKGLSLPLKKRQRDAERAVERARAVVVKARRKLAQSKKKGRLQTKTKACRARLRDAKSTLEQAELEAHQACADRDEASAAIRLISQAYHPYNLQTGAKRRAADVGELIDEAFRTLDGIAEHAGLTHRARGRIDKAWRVVEAMLDSITWAHTEMATRLSALTLSQAEATAVHAKLMPGLYIELAANKAKKAEDRHTLRATAAELLAEFDAAMTAQTGFDKSRRQALYASARESVLAFQRSSSCVEGRNGHLALFHHGTHRLSRRKLRALTVVHNFHTRRADGSTAAERLFRGRHVSLFERVLARLPSWPRPAKKRSAKRRADGGQKCA